MKSRSRDGLAVKAYSYAHVISGVFFFITDMTKEEMSSPKCISRFKLQASFVTHT